jgi:hypothetical protein
MFMGFKDYYTVEVFEAFVESYLEGFDRFLETLTEDVDAEPVLSNEDREKAIEFAKLAAEWHVWNNLPSHILTPTMKMASKSQIFLKRKEDVSKRFHDQLQKFEKHPNGDNILNMGMTLQHKYIGEEERQMTNTAERIAKAMMAKMRPLDQSDAEPGSILHSLDRRNALGKQYS